MVCFWWVHDMVDAFFEGWSFHENFRVYGRRCIAFNLGFLPVRWYMQWSKIWAVEGFQGRYGGLVCNVEVWRLARMEMVNHGSVRGRMVSHDRVVIEQFLHLGNLICKRRVVILFLFKEVAPRSPRLETTFTHRARAALRLVTSATPRGAQVTWRDLPRHITFRFSVTKSWPGPRVGPWSTVVTSGTKISADGAVQAAPREERAGGGVTGAVGAATETVGVVLSWTWAAAGAVGVVASASRAV